MVRNCVVQTCSESDKTILAHRFPKVLDNRKKWQDSLGLQDYDLEQLYNKYVVCINHFRPSDYRNAVSKHLNVTAVPHLSSRRIEKVLDKTSQPISIVEIDESEENTTSLSPAPTISVQNIEYAPLKRKRTNEETNKDIKKLTKEAYKKPKSKSAVLSIQSDKNSMNYEQLQPEGHVEPKISEKLIQVEDSNEVPIVEVVFTEASCQTEEKIDTSEFSSLSRTELVQLLKDKDEKIEALEKKIAKFESAMSAFKVLMNPMD